ncbi:MULTISPECIES: hypothetical protein [unclassified Microcoleus]|uniref:hypothetical protein n=1 Tax=unclassified Microcoleus TaxID=2642155 RepID=UPI002FD126EE
MTKAKKGIEAIKAVLAQADDKAEFDSLSVLEETDTRPVSEQNESMTLNDFAKQFDDDDDGINVFDETISLGKNITNVLALITTGLRPWEYKFLAAYASLPSMLCKILPIVELIGQAGSGKTQLLLAVSAISGQTVISGQSTGASLKNHINAIRWADPETKSHEKNTLLLIDNLNEDSFKKEEYLSSFLNGYNRKTDRCFISNGRGQNIEFKTFCPKMYTTIWEKTSTELSRRTIVIRTTKTAKLDNVLDPDDIYWQPLRDQVKNFWQEEETWYSFKSLAKSFSAIPKPKHSKEHWTLLKWVLTSGVAIGVWDTLESAINETSNWLENALKLRITLLEVLVLQSLEDILGFKQSEWQTLSQSVQIHISPRHLKDALDVAIRDGLIDKPKLTEVQQVLTKLGFSAGKKDNQLGYSYKGFKQ